MREDKDDLTPHNHPYENDFLIVFYSFSITVVVRWNLKNLRPWRLQSDYSLKLR